jgi:hypothetical protein
VWIEGTYFSNVYVYSGTSRTNLTTVIENNKTASIGAPVQIPADDGVVIIVQPFTPTGSLPAAFRISYQVKGEKYPWYEKLFLGKAQWVYYLGVSGFTAATALLLCCCPMILCIIVCVTIHKRKKRPAGIVPTTAKTSAFKPKPHRPEIVTEMDDDHT